MNELWKDIPGYEGLYQASTLGNIRSLDREITQVSRWGTTVTRRYPGKVFEFGGHSQKDYYAVLIKDKKYSVHSLILATFQGPMPDDCDVVRHLDGNCFNNRLDNLAYGTFSDNVLDLYRQGQTNGSGKLSIEDVMGIRRLTEQRISQRKIAATYGISRRTVRNVQSGASYFWLSEDGVING